METIGKIETLDGEVVVTHTDGTSDVLTVGDDVYQGDQIETGSDGSIGVILLDDTMFSMGESGQITLDEMVYDPETQEGSIAMDLASGVFTFVSGEIAKTDPDAMVLNTPVATIGIRGTQVGLDVSNDQADVVLMKEADGFVGEIIVSNEFGAQVINVANMGTSISEGEAPTEPSLLTAREIADQYKSSLQALPAEDGNANTYGVESDAPEEGSMEEELALEEGVFEEELALEEGELTDEDLANFETAAGDEELAAEETATEEELAMEEGDGEEELADEDLGEFETAAGEVFEEELALEEDASGMEEFAVAIDELSPEDLAAMAKFNTMAKAIQCFQMVMNI